MIEALANLPTDASSWGLIGDREAAQMVANTIVGYIQDNFNEQEEDELDEGQHLYKQVIATGSQDERRLSANRLIEGLRDYMDEMYPESGDPGDDEDEEHYGNADDARCGLGDTEQREAMYDHVYKLFGVEDHQSGTFAAYRRD